MPMPSSSPTLRTVADNTNVSPLVAITSLASHTQHVTVSCLPEHGRRFTKSLDLRSNATVVTSGCGADDRYTTDFESMAKSGNDSTGGAFGIELTSDGPPGAFAAFALAKHRNGDDEYFSARSAIPWRRSLRPPSFRACRLDQHLYYRQVFIPRYCRLLISGTRQLMSL